MDDGDSNGGEFGHVHDFVAVQIVNLAVGNEIEITAVDGPKRALYLLFFILLRMNGERKTEETGQQAGGVEDSWPRKNHHHLREGKIVINFDF
jgi:hypothetical protein